MKNKDKKSVNSKPKTQKATPKAKAKPQLSETTLRRLSRLLPVAAVVVAVAALIVYENDYLYRLQELNLFLYTPLFFKQQMVVSGGFLSYLGCYFTQFLYHPWLGATLLGAWWLLLMWLVKRAFRIPAKWSVALLVPVALLLIADVDLGYWIFYLKLRGHFFAATIGTAVAVALVWTYRLLPAKFFCRTMFIVATVAAGYPLFGAYALLAALLMAIIAWQLDDYGKLHRGIDTVVAVVAIAVVPLICYSTIYVYTNIINIYSTALPLYKRNAILFVYYAPYILLAVALSLMALSYQRKRNNAVTKTFAWLLSEIALLAVIAVSVWHFWYKDENFHAELSMYRHATDLQWEEILTEYRKHDTAPSRNMWMMKNLALARLGRQGDEMYHYRNCDTPANAPFIARATQYGGKLIYYNYGLLNYCYRWCMEDGVEFGWHIEHLIYMTKCSLMNGEPDVAQKYIDILKTTKYYGEWARKYETYVRKPELMKKDPEFEAISHLLPPFNQITSDQSLIEIFLIDHFAHKDSDDPVFQEQAVLFALQFKDIATFWRRFAIYTQNLNGKRVPIHMQEAAYLYGHLENTVDISRMPFDQSVVDSYNNFMTTAKQYNYMEESELKKFMYDRFGGTFYYDYFFTRGQHSF